MKRCVHFGLLLAITAMSAFQARSQEAEKKGWETTAFATLTMTRGNSHTMLTTIGIDTKRKWDDRDFSAGAGVGYGNDDGARNTDFARAYAQYNQDITERWYWGVRADGDHDGNADLSYRVKLSPLLGYYIIKNDKMLLAVEAGPSFIVERYDPSPTDPDPATKGYVALRFAERFEYKITETTKVWEMAEYLPYLKDFPDKYLINAEAGISTEITKKWDLRVVVEIRHDSEPPAGKDKTDYRLLAGTGYKF